MYNFYLLGLLSTVLIVAEFYLSVRQVVQACSDSRAPFHLSGRSKQVALSSPVQLPFFIIFLSLCKNLFLKIVIVLHRLLKNAPGLPLENTICSQFRSQPEKYVVSLLLHRSIDNLEKFVSSSIKL